MDPEIQAPQETMIAQLCKHKLGKCRLEYIPPGEMRVGGLYSDAVGRHFDTGGDGKVFIWRQHQ